MSSKIIYTKYMIIFLIDFKYIWQISFGQSTSCMYKNNSVYFIETLFLFIQINFILNQKRNLQKLKFLPNYWKKIWFVLFTWSFCLTNDFCPIIKSASDSMTQKVKKWLFYVFFSGQRTPSTDNILYTKFIFKIDD